MDVMITSGGRPEDQPRPRGDCSVRALAIFLDIPYPEAEELLYAHTDYQPNKGVTNFQLYALLKDLGMRYTQNAVRLSAKNAKQRLPERCILIFRSHVAAYIEGTVYDSFNLMQAKGTKQTRGYYTLGGA